MPEIIKTKIRGVKANNDDGTSRQEIIDQFIEIGDSLLLEPELNNIYDKNAVAVFVDRDNNQKFKIGYLGSDLAARIAPQFANKKIITCEVLDKTGENNEIFGVNCQIEIWTSEEIKAETERLKLLEQTRLKDQIKTKNKKRYGIGPWRAIIGIFCIFSSIIIFQMVSEDPSIIILAFMFLIPAGILLLPWERWVFDQLKKMLARNR